MYPGVDFYEAAKNARVLEYRLEIERARVRKAHMEELKRRVRVTDANPASTREQKRVASQCPLRLQASDPKPSPEQWRTDATGDCSMR